MQNGGASAESTTPRSSSGRPLVRLFHDGGGGRSSNGVKRLKMIEDDEEDGTKEEQAEFMKELEAFHKARCLDFKPPKFYGEPLNCLKLWRAVVQLGGYDRVTTYKLWRQVGESFHPPKTCTTISWTFRIFYEKVLLEYEKHKREIGEVEFPDAPGPEPTSAENEGNACQTGSGRVRRDAAARAMQGWHSQWNSGFGEVGGTDYQGVKQKKPSNPELAENEMPEANKQIDPLHTSAVVSLHGRLFVRVPFDQSNKVNSAICYR
ncbi:AT-rich interactive domain-containing protein 5 [Bienertia sinuspersici]